MKFARIAVEKVQRLTPVIRYVENVPDTTSLALQTFGIYQPVYINQTTRRILNPVWFNTLLEQKPALIDCLILDVPEEIEIPLSIALNGGVEGWAYNRPANPAEIVPHLQRMMNENRPALLALGGEPDYWIKFFRWLDSPALPATIAGGLALEPEFLLPDDFDIPRLDLALQPDSIPAGITAWNSHGRPSGRKQYTAYHFYVEDFRFSALAKKPETLIEMGVQVAVEPNFSTHEQQPMIEAFHDIYRKRQIARRWQDAGVCTIVDMNVTRRYLLLNLVGVPAGWHVYANRAYMHDLEHLHIAYDIARKHSGGDDILYMVYGGPGCRPLCQQHGWIWIDAGKTLDGAGYGERNQAHSV